MKKVIHFSSQEERLAFLKGRYEEIVPEKAEPVKEEKPKKKKATRKKKEAKDEVQAE